MSSQSPTHFFQINPSNLKRFSRRSVYFTRPRVLRLYDVQDGKISSAKKLKYFREPKLCEYPLDLNDAFDTFNFDSIPNDLNNMLSLHYEMTVSASRRTIQNIVKCSDRMEHTAVYSRRGTLRYIMEFCYDYKFDRNIFISRYDGKLYLFTVDGEVQEREKKPVFTHHSRLCRQLFVDDPNGVPKLDQPYDVIESQHILHHANLGKFEITYSGKVKGIISDAKFDKINDINAVNKRRFVQAKQMWLHLKNNDLKLLDYWLQAYLANVEDLYMAYKDKDGVVREPIEHIKVSDIPKNRRWKPSVCTAFLNEFLERVEQLMWNVDSLDIVYEFHFSAKDKMIQYEIHEGKPEKIVIPKDYIEFAKKKNKVVSS